MQLLWVAVGGAIGATARYLLGGLIHRFTSPFFPYGTLTVNLVGCFLFGIVIGLADERFVIGPTGRVFLLIGVLGGFTTFSTYTYETLQLLRDGELGRALVNMGGQVVGGLVVLWAAYVGVRAIAQVP